jgi:hypothetical protein
MKKKNSTHYFEIKDLITQFCAAFDSIIIGRFNKEREIQDELRVRFAYMPKQRMLHSLTNKAEHLTLPAIGVWVTNISRDSERVQSKNAGHVIAQDNNHYDVPQPVPVNITVNMSIMTRHKDDMDQILANFIPYSDPYIVISWKMPEDSSPLGTEIRSEVLWDGNITLDHLVTKGEADKNRSMAETSFIIKGWLFKKIPETPTGNIYEIDSTFYAISSLSDINLDPDELQSETVGISAYPTLTFTKETRFITNTTPTHKLEGTNFDYTTTVYLSADNSNIFADPLSSYDEFDGIPLSSDEYSITTDNILYVDVRLLNDIGNVSIIIENPAGYVVSNPIEVVSL